MKQKNQSQVDRHLDTPSEANRDKHINFPEVEQDSSNNFVINKNTSDRQKQWQEEIEQGEKEKQNSDQRNSSTMPMGQDDTLGIP